MPSSLQIQMDHHTVHHAEKSQKVVCKANGTISHNIGARCCKLVAFYCFILNPDKCSKTLERPISLGSRSVHPCAFRILG